MSRQRRTGPVGSGTGSGTQVDAEVRTTLRHRPDSLHRSPVGVVRHLVLSVDPLDLGILTALALTWPIGWWSA